MKFQTASIGHGCRARFPQNNRVLNSKQGPGSQTSHNSGSRSPFDTLTSALDRKFQDTSIEHGCRPNFIPNKTVFKTKVILWESRSETMSNRRGLKFPVQRTSQCVKRTSGARVMACSTHRQNWGHIDDQPRHVRPHRQVCLSACIWTADSHACV